MVCRNKSRAEAAKDEIVEQSKNQVMNFILDLFFFPKNYFFLFFKHFVPFCILFKNFSSYVMKIRKDTYMEHVLIINSNPIKIIK